MYVYDGTQWIAASAASTAILTVFRYTATAGQTTFTGADDNSLTLTYTAGSAIITVNGAVMEVGVDVTATTGTSIVLAQAALVGDEVNIYAFATFNIANTYTQAEVDAFAVKLTGNQTVAGVKTFSSSPVVAGLTDSGNLTFTGTGNRILGDFSNATFSNRVWFQTSASNSPTSIGVIPSGTSTSSSLHAYSSSSPDNSSRIRIVADGAAPSISFISDASGTGTSLPMTFVTGGSERLRIDTSGNCGIGTNSPNAKVEIFKDGAPASSGNMNTGVVVAAAAGSYAINIGANSSGAYTWINSAFQNNSGTASPLAFMTGATERMRIDSSGKLIVSSGAAYSVAIEQGNQITYSRNSANYIVANGGASSSITVQSNTNGVILNNAATSWSSASDERLKDIIEPITDAANKVSSLRAVIGKYKTEEDGTRRTFLIAQDVQAVLPEAVVEVTKETGESYLSLAYTDTIPLLVAAIQEQQALITQLQADVAALKGTI